MVDTTPDSTKYQNKLMEIGIDCVHIHPHLYPSVICLVYTVSKAWEVIVREAWDRGVDYILSLESDIIAPPETIDVMVCEAEESGAWVIAHGYPYIGIERPVHSLGCMLINRRLFEPGESLHNPPARGVVEIGRGNFEDLVWTKPVALGLGCREIDNRLDIEHFQTYRPAHGPGSHG
jgi:hypothetical protein